MFLLALNDLSWDKLVNVTTDGSPNLTGKNVGLLKIIEDKVREVSANTDLREDIGIFLDSGGKADDFPKLRDEG